MNAVYYRVVSGVVRTNRTMVSSNTDTNRAGRLHTKPLPSLPSMTRCNCGRMAFAAVTNDAHYLFVRPGATYYSAYRPNTASQNTVARELREFDDLQVRLHSSVYTRASDVCSLAASPESRGHCYLTPASMGIATSFLATQVGQRGLRLLASQQGEPGSIPGRFTPDFRKWESCHTMSLVGGFSRGSLVAPPLHSKAAPYSPHFTLTGSQDLTVKSRPKLFTHSLTHSKHKHKILFCRDPGSIPGGVASGFSHFGNVPDHRVIISDSDCVVVRLLASHLSEPCPIAGWFTLDFLKGESCRTMPLVGGDLPFHSGAAPYSPRFTLVGSQDLAVKSRTNLFTHALRHFTGPMRILILQGRTFANDETALMWAYPFSDRPRESLGTDLVSDSLLHAAKGSLLAELPSGHQANEVRTFFWPVKPFCWRVSLEFVKATFAIGAQFIRPALHASEPIANFQGNTLRISILPGVGQQPMNTQLRLQYAKD
ncbi:hypothetical protein PR048_031272 [Dryococelus australis]|uniref:Uncharacterized protein n=1 Tax=Dryococelus australis TaxID=614101 RepID=A0ABQ9G4S2_9NEOP|nr:hypothetical protein PR048_031272 [Dryococelus australis]